MLTRNVVRTFLCFFSLCACIAHAPAQAGFLAPKSTHEDEEAEEENPFIISFPGKGGVGRRPHGGKDTKGYWDAEGNFTEKMREAANARLKEAKEKAKDLYEKEIEARIERRKEREEAQKERKELDKAERSEHDWAERRRDREVEREARDARWNAGTQNGKKGDLAWATRQREEQQERKNEKRDDERLERDLRNAERAAGRR